MAEENVPSGIAAIILNYFGAEKTFNCLGSLAKEPLDAIWLVENSANAEALEELKSALTRLPGDLQGRIRLLVSEENLGFGKAINRAITADRAGGEQQAYYLLLNNDTVVDPGMVSGLRDRLLAEPNCALAAPRLVYPDFELDKLWYYRYLGHVGQHARKSMAMPYLTGCCLLVDASIASPDGLFDEDFFMYGEDIWLNWHVMSLGRSIASVPEVSLFHEGTGSSKIGSLFYEYHSARGHVLLAKKMGSNVAELAANYIGRAVYLLVRAVVRAARHRSWLPMKAYLMCWRHHHVRPQG